MQHHYITVISNVGQGSRNMMSSKLYSDPYIEHISDNMSLTAMWERGSFPAQIIVPLRLFFLQGKG